MKEIKHFHDSDLKGKTKSCRNCIHFNVCMHWQGLQDKYLKQSHTSEQDFYDSNLYEDCEFYEVAESDIIAHQKTEIETLKNKLVLADDTIYEIEDALNRGADNDWARECIEEYKSEMEVDGK